MNEMWTLVCWYCVTRLCVSVFYIIVWTIYRPASGLVTAINNNRMCLKPQPYLVIAQYSTSRLQPVRKGRQAHKKRTANEYALLSGCLSEPKRCCRCHKKHTREGEGTKNRKRENDKKEKEKTGKKKKQKKLLCIKEMKSKSFFWRADAATKAPLKWASST